MKVSVQLGQVSCYTKSSGKAYFLILICQNSIFQESLFLLQRNQLVRNELQQCCPEQSGHLLVFIFTWPISHFEGESFVFGFLQHDIRMPICHFRSVKRLLIVQSSHQLLKNEKENSFEQFNMVC